MTPPKIYTLKINIASIWVGLNPETVPQQEGKTRPTLFKDD